MKVSQQESKKDSVDAIAEEIKKLKEEISRQAKELPQKNRELDIEASLEKVRIVSMAMKHPGDMIEICRTISNQLRQLKINNIRNIQTAIIDNKKGTYLNYEYFTQYDTSSILEIESKLHPRVQEFVDTVNKSADAFFTTTFNEKELKEWREYRKTTKQIPDVSYCVKYS